MQEIELIKSRLVNDRPEPWEKLPDIDLYMDQVVSYLPRQSVGGKPPAITSAMINNYVKAGLLPRANGKRYHKEHMVYLTVIGLLKNILTVKDMQLLLEHELVEGKEEAFYKNFLQDVDDTFHLVDASIDATLTTEDMAELALQLALASCATKSACEQLLDIIASEKTQVKSGKKEKKGKSVGNEIGNES